MSLKRKLMLVICLLLASCSQKPTVTNIYKGLERVASVERKFEQEQEPLILLEKQERELYESILSLGLHDKTKRQELAEKAEQSLLKREQHLTKEHSGLHEAKEVFAEVRPLFAQLQGDELKQGGRELTNSLQERYDIYEQLYVQYKRALQKDRELYNLLQSEAIAFGQIQKQIEEINKEYEQVLRLNRTFNNYTVQYNASKEEFYKRAGLKIKRLRS